MRYVYNAPPCHLQWPGQVGKLKTRVEAAIVQGPIKVGMVTGVYVVRADNGEEEHVHADRLTRRGRRNGPAT
jgi:hypothetical protein